MRLPIILPRLAEQKWDCHGCTDCCRKLVVHLTRRDRDEIDRQGWGGRIEGPAYIRLGRQHVLNHRPGGGCVFLSKAGRCRIHEEFGSSAKPLACQLFPFSLHRDGEALAASIRFDCPSACGNRGSPMPSHKGEISRIAGLLHESEPGVFGPVVGPPRLNDGRTLSPRELDHLVLHVERILARRSHSLVDRLLCLLSLIDTLDTARLADVREGRFEEFLKLLQSDQAGFTADSTLGSLPPPSARQQRLLRMAVFSHCEHITLAQAGASIFCAFRYRIGQLRKARLLARGIGRIPPLIEGRGSATFEALVEVPPHQDLTPGDRDELLIRYLRSRLLGGTAFGAGYYGWSVLDGLRSLLLTVPVMFWLARYLAFTDGRSAYSLPDWRQAAGLVDRHAGRARELGSTSARMRVRYLSRDQGLARLLLAEWRFFAPQAPA